MRNPWACRLCRVTFHATYAARTTTGTGSSYWPIGSTSASAAAHCATMGRPHGRIIVAQRDPGVGWRAGRRKERDRCDPQPRHPAGNLRRRAPTVPSRRITTTVWRRPGRGAGSARTSPPASLFRLASESGGRGTLVLVLGLRGLRWGEMAGLHVADVDSQRRRLSVVRSATTVGNHVAVFASAASDLDRIARLTLASSSLKGSMILLNGGLYSASISRGTSSLQETYIFSKMA